MRRTRRVRVVVSYPRVGSVRILARAPRRGRRVRRFTHTRLVTFKRPGRKRVSLRLTRLGVRLARRGPSGCRPIRIAVIARARRYRRVNGRYVFSPRYRSRRSRFTKRRLLLRPDPARCRARAPAPGGGSGGGGSASSFTRAGSASSDITPPIGTPMFAYTARSNLADPSGALQIVADPDENLYAKTFEPSEGIHTRVRARAIVIEQAGRKFAMVQTDLGGLPYALVQEVLRRVEGMGITGDRLLLSATHTHSSTGPIWPIDSSGYALLGGDAFDTRVFQLTAQGIAEAITEANARLEPAKVGWGTAELRGASRNRAFDAFRRNPDVPVDEAEARQRSIDPTVTVVRVDDLRGRPMGAWSNFAIHPTSFGDENLLFSGDNAATAERVAESAMVSESAARGLAPPAGREVVNVWTNASEGDVSPEGGPDRDGGDPLQYVPNSFASANLAGRRVADGIVRAWRAAAPSMSTTRELSAKRSFVAFDGTSADGEPVGPLAVLGAGGITLEDGFCAPVDNMAGPGQGSKFPQLAGAGLVPQIAPVSVWRVGRLGIVALPAEITKQMGQRIRSALQRDGGADTARFAVAGLTNGYVSYTSTPEEYDACGYEGSFTLFGRRQGPRWLSFSRALFDSLRSGRPFSGAPEPPPVGLGTGPFPTTDETPDAGQVVDQPAASLRRFERAVFRWRGGDATVDAPRGRTFVSLQRRRGSSWRTVGTDDSYSDTTALGDDGIWSETWQFASCDPVGSYRFHVRGVADRGNGPEPYELASRQFTVGATQPLQVTATGVTGGKARVTAVYPDPGAGALVALPRRVRTGSATLVVNGEIVIARPDSARLRFEAPAPDGASVSVLRVKDGCGNEFP